MTRRPRADAARLAAFDLMRAVADEGAYANLRLPTLLRERGLGSRDAAFATELAFGTLRLRGRYDAVIDLCSKRGIAAIDPRVLDVLRLGAHQILGMAVPSYAAVSSSVTMTHQVAGAGAASFVNAILRRVAGTPQDEWLAQLRPLPDDDPLGHLAVVHSHPRWIADALRESLGAIGQTDELAALLAADNTAPPLTLIARPGRIERDGLIARTGGTPGRWSPLAVRVSGDPARFADVRSGAAAVQDEASQLVALALARAPVDGPDDHWLDMCAGPGGKAGLLAGLAAGAGTTLTAVERHPHRARLVEAAVAGSDADVRVLTGDVLTADLPGRFSRILLDAPCTGLGAVRRRPELRWRRTPGDVSVLADQQRDLLAAACDLVGPGGVIGYVTCSPHLAESDAIVAPMADRRFRAIDAGALLPEVGDTGPGPHVRLWPHRHDTDGMFLALYAAPV